MGLFRRLLRREDAYDDLDDPGRAADAGDAADLNDAFADDQEDEEPGGSLAGTVSKVLAAMVVAGLFAAVILYAYSWTSGARDQSGQNVPVVEAEPGPEKVKPEDPGGMDVPYQDQLVLNQGDTNAETETLLPPPEAPRAPETGGGGRGAANTQSGTTGDADPAPGSGGAAPGDQQVARTDGSRTPDGARGEQPDGVTGTARDRDGTGETPDAAGRGSGGGDPDAPVPRPGDKPAAPEAADAPAAGDDDGAGPSEGDRARAVSGDAGAGDAAAAETSADGPDAALEEGDGAAGGGDVLIQLAAFQKRANAETAWQRIREKHRNLLGNQKLQLQRVRIPEKGIFWRVRTGPFPNRATAADLCGQLKARGQPCLVMEN